MEKLFKLRENGTTVRTEIMAGLTTFMTMAYIIALNPNLLTNFGAEGKELWNGVFLATCIASAIGTITMAFLANKPFAMGPGMGLNSLFAVVAKLRLTSRRFAATWDTRSTLRRQRTTMWNRNTVPLRAASTYRIRRTLRRYGLQHRRKTGG